MHRYAQYGLKVIKPVASSCLEIMLSQCPPQRFFHPVPPSQSILLTLVKSLCDLLSVSTFTTYHTTSLCPRLNPHPEPKRLPQEPLPRLQLPLLPTLSTQALAPHPMLIPEFEISDHTCHNHTQLHLRHISPHTRPRPIAEWDERVLLCFCEFVPTLRDEGIGVGSPDGLGVVDGVGGDGESSAGRELVAEDLDGFGVRVLGGSHGC